jgi:hypothetical protein
MQPQELDQPLNSIDNSICPLGPDRPKAKAAISAKQRSELAAK